MFQRLKSSTSTPVHRVKSESSGPLYRVNWIGSSNEFLSLHTLRDDVISPEFIGTNILKTVSNGSQCKEDRFCQCLEDQNYTDTLYDAQSREAPSEEQERVRACGLVQNEGSAICQEGFKQLYPYPSSLNYCSPKYLAENECTIYPKPEKSAENICLTIKTDPVMLYPKTETEDCDFDTKKYTIHTKLRIRPKNCLCGCSTENLSKKQISEIIYPPQEVNSCKPCKEQSYGDFKSSSTNCNLRKCNSTTEQIWPHQSALDFEEQHISRIPGPSMIDSSSKMHCAKSDGSVCSSVLDDDGEHAYGNISNFEITELLQRIENLGQQWR